MIWGPQQVSVLTCSEGGSIMVELMTGVSQWGYLGAQCWDVSVSLGTTTLELELKK